jgi:hypothetical protein
VKEFIAIAIGSILGVVSAHFVSQKTVVPPPPHVEEFNAKYRSGTTPLARQSLLVRITPEQIILVQKDKQFAIPISSITFLAYSDSKAKRYLAALQWKATPRGEVVFAIDRQDFRRVVGVLTALYHRSQGGTEGVTEG